MTAGGYTPLERELLAYVDENGEKALEFLRQVLAFDTTNFISSGREAQCQAFIAESFRALGAQTELYDTRDMPQVKALEDYAHGRDADHRPNVTAVLPGENPQGADARRMMISSHVDTMPVGDLSQWRYDPFGGQIANGRMYGLGVSDNKFGSAISWLILSAVRDLGLRLQNGLCLSVVSDEEYFGGNGSLLACKRYPCDLYINLDGCDYEVQVAALGGTLFELRVQCDFETSSCVSVVDALYEARKALESFGQRRFLELEEHPLYTGSDHAKSAYRIMEFGCGTLGTNVDLGVLKLVVYSTATREQLYRELDEIFTRHIEPYLQENGLRSEGFTRSVRCMEFAQTRNETQAAALAELIAQQRGQLVPLRGACLSDLDIYLRNGSPDSFNTGLIREFRHEGGAHKPNEYISCSDFLGLAKSLLLFVSRWCGFTRETDANETEEL